MEFTTGRRDGTFHIIEEGKNEEASTHPSFLPFSSSSSLPSTSTAFGWHLGSSDIAGNGAGDGRNDSNFFVQKEHMFDKVVTPSDVGKLNRLVIPKQHAEKYFPLDPTVNEKGLLLSFEDRTGKSWRFRYSYWNSSQSYVMTKGWSRFVKEKRLDAGDIVSFGRGVGESGRDHLYIDWRRRPDNRDLPGPPLAPLTGVSMARPLGPWSGRFFAPTGAVYDHHHLGFGYSAMNSGTTSGGQLLFFTSSAAGPSQTAVQNGGSSGLPMVLNSLPLVRNQTETRRVRLFGVNLDCPESEGNAGQLPAGPSPSAPQLQSSSMHPFLSFPHGSMESSPTSSSTSKEQQLTLDLGL